MYKIHSKLKAMKASFSIKTNNLQRSLTRVLIVQAVNPLIFQIIPTTLVNELPDFVLGGVISTIVITWGPVANGLMTIFLIKPYRQKIYSTVFKKNYAHTISRVTDTAKNQNESTIRRPISIQ